MLPVGFARRLSATTTAAGSAGGSLEFPPFAVAQRPELLLPKFNP
jgi:hypothetical protein